MDGKSAVSDTRSNWPLARSVILIVALGSILTAVLMSHGRTAARRDLMKVVHTASAGLDPALVAKLTGSASDVDSVEFDLVRRRLIRIRQANPQVRFIYLMGMKEDRVVFLAGAEPPESEDYSAPGDVYDEASAELLQALRDGESFTEGPLKDRWGEWVSGHVAIRDPQSKAVVALLGMDIDAVDWHSHISVYMYLGISVTLFSFFLTLLFHVDLGKLHRGNALLKNEIQVRQLTGEALRKEKETAQSYLDTAEDVFLVVNRDQTVVMINKKGCAVLGCPESDIVGKNWFDTFIPERDRQRALDQFEKTCSGQADPQEYFENPVRTRNGEERAIAWRHTAVRDERGHVGGVLSSGEDVTLRRKTDAAIKSILVNGSSKVGSRFFEAMVKELTKILGADYAIIGEIPEEDNSTMRTLAVCADGDLAEGFEHDMTNSPCGNTLEPSLCSYPSNVSGLFPDCGLLKEMGIEGWVGISLYDSQNRRTGVLATMFRKPLQDVQLAETVLTIFASRTAAEIERKREEEIREIIEARLLQMNKMESLNTMAGSIAHNFNNILQVSLGYLDLALQDLPPDSPAVQFVKKADQSARRAAELSTLMLNYAGQGVKKKSPVNLSSVIRDMEKSMQTDFSDNIQLRENLLDNLPDTQADPECVEKMVRSLVTNAAEAIGDEAGTISVATGVIECDREYFLQTYLYEGQSEGLYVYLEVCDTGCGMDEEFRLRIFDPFFTTKFPGRGLGLAFVLGAVRQHKGAITISSEPNFGTTIKILLPTTDRRALSQAESGQPPQSPACERRLNEKLETWKPKGKVLLVDDEETVRAVAKEMLQRQGFSVLTARDGVEGVAKFRKSADEIQCVLLDLSMPGMNGAETLEKLLEIRPDVRVIIASGSNISQVERLFVDKGANGFIQKPYQATVLRRILHEVLEGLGVRG